MATHLALDDALIQEALQVGGPRTKKGVVTEALEEYVKRRKQLKIRNLFHTIDYDPDYDYKTQRRQV